MGNFEVLFETWLVEVGLIAAIGTYVINWRLSDLPCKNTSILGPLNLKKMVKIIRWLEVKIILTWPAWVVMCYFRFEPEENLLLQYGHANGFSPVWMRMCRILFEI